MDFRQLEDGLDWLENHDDGHGRLVARQSVKTSGETPRVVEAAVQENWNSLGIDRVAGANSGQINAVGTSLPA